MHELSIVMSIVDIATKELQKAHASCIEEIELEIGTLSGIEMESFDFAWQQAIKETPLAHAERKVNRIAAQANCPNCRLEFGIEQLWDTCPVCSSHCIQITKGKELRVKSLVVN